MGNDVGEGRGRIVFFSEVPEHGVPFVDGEEGGWLLVREDAGGDGGGGGGGAGAEVEDGGGLIGGGEGFRDGELVSSVNERFHQSVN